MTWGGAPWAALRARNGFRVSFALKTAPVFSDANGVLDLTLEELAVEVRFVPASPGGPAEADVLAALYIEAAPGRLVLGGGQLLSIRGDSLAVTLAEAAVIRAGLDFSAEQGRVGECGFRAGRAFLDAAIPLAEVEG